MLVCTYYHTTAGCDRNIDCVFMLDQSGSVGEENHAIAIEFIRNVVNFFTIGLDSTRIGLIAYSRYAHLEFDLDDHTTLNELQQEINEIRYRGGSTSTSLALNGTRIVLDPINGYGARPNSAGIPKIGILITGEVSNVCTAAFDVTTLSLSLSLSLSFFHQMASPITIPSRMLLLL